MLQRALTLFETTSETAMTKNNSTCFDLIKGCV